MLSKLSPLFSSSLRAQRSNPRPSPLAGEGDLKNLQIVFSKRTRDKSFSDLFRESCVNIFLCNNMTNLLTKLGTRCHKILGTRPRMTGAENIGLVRSVIFSVRLLLFLLNPAKASVATEKVHLIRCIGFAERERDLLFAYFSSFFPHFLLISILSLSILDRVVK